MTFPSYFITWTTYGTWLHGDGRGSIVVRGLDSIQIDENIGRLGRTAVRLAEQPFVMNMKTREIVDLAIRRHAVNRGWLIHALNVRTNHVHLITSASGHRPEIVAGQFKYWATRDLKSASLIAERDRVWTRKASTRWINDHESLLKATDYVKRHQ